MLSVSGVHHSFGQDPHSDRPLVGARAGRKEVLRGVSFNLETSQIGGLIGPSGGGKSVLLKILAGVLTPEAGSVTYSDPLGQTVSLMFQEGALFDSLNVFDNVAFGLVAGEVPTYLLEPKIQAEVREKVSLILAQVGLTKAAFKFPGQLSGGMRRRVALARALVSRPRLLLLDDPTAGLDPVASSVIMELILELHRKYTPTTIIVSHDLRRLLPAVEAVMALFEGRILFQGKLNELEVADAPNLHAFVGCRYDFV